MKMITIPEFAAQIVEKTILKVNETNSRSIFVVGSSRVGKTTLLYSLFDKNDTPRETLVLEYSFGRKSNQKQGLEKTICHIWEYGGKLDILKETIASIPIKGKYYFCIMIDLSKIKNIWNTLESCVEAITDTESEKNPELILICGKYDLFKNYDADIKKVVCTTIRSVALHLEANVLFYSSKEPQLARRAKEMLHGMGFGNGVPVKEKISHFTKPLIISKGTDSWESIGVPVSNFEQIKARYLSRISSDSGITAADVTAAPQKAHPEPSLDSKLRSKFDELRNSTVLDMSTDEYLLSLH